MAPCSASSLGLLALTPDAQRDPSVLHTAGRLHLAAWSEVEANRSGARLSVAYYLHDCQPDVGSAMTEVNETGPSRECPWCSALVPPDATHCPSCGATLAQRELIGDLAIPGVTTVDAALEAYAAEPLPIPLPIPSSVDPIGGSPYLTGMAGLAALAAPDGTRTAAPVDPSSVGESSDAGLKAAEQLDREDASR